MASRLCAPSLNWHPDVYMMVSGPSLSKVHDMHKISYNIYRHWLINLESLMEETDPQGCANVRGHHTKFTKQLETVEIGYIQYYSTNDKC